jgi:hypothetical protein
MALRAAGGDFDSVQYEFLADGVIEGQQRLKSLELYLSDQLAAPDAPGDLTLWSELAEMHQRRFATSCSRAARFASATSSASESCTTS